MQVDGLCLFVKWSVTGCLESQRYKCVEMQVLSMEVLQEAAGIYITSKQRCLHFILGAMFSSS